MLLNTKSGGVGVVLVAVGLSALSGCGMVTRGESYAVIDGNPITQADVEETRTAFEKLSGQPLATKDVLDALITAPFVVSQVERSGKWKPDATYAATLAKFDNPSPTTKELLEYVFIRNANALDQADSTAVITALRKANIQVSPRFGTFMTEANAVGLKDHTPDWIAAAATAAPNNSAGQ